ncbi:hypothetical protein TNCV_3237331 [Trichonephila clavipes]|nr:hypothetical protein TNCV_3237331 [Trichonephila clavipes]
MFCYVAHSKAYNYRLIETLNCRVDSRALTTSNKESFPLCSGEPQAPNLHQSFGSYFFAFRILCVSPISFLRSHAAWTAEIFYVVFSLFGTRGQLTDSRWMVHCMDGNLISINRRIDFSG